jgi:hypothetical protein
MGSQVQCLHLNLFSRNIWKLFINETNVLIFKSAHYFQYEELEFLIVKK